MSAIARHNLCVACVSACVLVALGRTDASGQGRKIVRLTPALVPARHFASGLEAYSFGLGTLERSRPGGDSGVLRSSISIRPSFSIDRTSARPGRPSPPTRLPARVARPGSRRLPKSDTSIPSPWIVTPPAPAAVRRPFALASVHRNPGGNVLSLTYDYLEAIGAISVDPLRDSPGQITTLVPDRPGVYRLYMSRGEAAFRTGDFASAFDEFRIAHDISGPSTESLLSLAHTRAAAGSGSYAAAAFYLQRVLRQFPELPLTPLDPKALFGSEARYRACVDRLAGHVKRRPQDVDPLLLWAYFLWFEGKPAAARQALHRAADARRSERSAEDDPGDRVLEAIEIFRRGIAAGGAVESTSRPGSPPRAPAASAPAPAPAPLP